MTLAGSGSVSKPGIVFKVLHSLGSLNSNAFFQKLIELYSIQSTLFTKFQANICDSNKCEKHVFGSVGPAHAVSFYS